MTKRLARPFLISGIIGLAVISMSVVLMIVFPSRAGVLMDGFFTPIMAFEFVQSPAEVQQLFGPAGSETRAATVAAMDLGNQLDFIYLVLYSAFLFSFSLTAARLTGQKQNYIATALAPLVLVADALENVQLLGITSRLATGDFESQLVLLSVCTWMKWGGIASIMAIFAQYFINGRIFCKVIAAFSFASLLLAIGAAKYRSFLNEAMGLTVALVFVLIIIYCFAYKEEIDGGTA